MFCPYSPYVFLTRTTYLTDEVRNQADQEHEHHSRDEAQGNHHG